MTSCRRKGHYNKWHPPSTPTTQRIAAQRLLLSDKNIFFLQILSIILTYPAGESCYQTTVGTARPKKQNAWSPPDPSPRGLSFNCTSTASLSQSTDAVSVTAEGRQTKLLGTQRSTSAFFSLPEVYTPFSRQKVYINFALRNHQVCFGVSGSSSPWRTLLFTRKLVNKTSRRRLFFCPSQLCFHIQSKEN